MDIVSLSEVKAFNGITTTDQDEQIKALIPVVSEAVLDWCKNFFMDDPTVYVLSDRIWTDNASSSIISDSVDFESEDFLAGHTIRINVSLAADGFYKVKTVTPMTAGQSTIVLDDDEDLPDSGVGPYTVVGRAIIPAGFKLALAKAIASSISSGLNTDIKSERIGDYAVTYADPGERSRIYQALGFGPYRKLMR